jgi:U4/U6.U5 tri-snRNP component SNU23
VKVGSNFSVYTTAKTNYEMSNSKQTVVDQVGRKTWDLAKFEEQAAAEALLDEAPEQSTGDGKTQKKYGVVLARKNLLQRRLGDLKLDEQVGTQQVVVEGGTLQQQGGFYCQVCDVLLKDSSSHLDHINGRKHQLALGMSMTVERATRQQVQARLQYHRERLLAEKAAKRDITSVQKRLNELHDTLSSKPAQLSQKKKKRKKPTPAPAAATAAPADAAVLAQLGFGSFGGSKKRR